jgi:ankyrin repeat protein
MLQLIDAFLEAVQAGDFSQARALLQDHPELARSDREGLYPLHYAVLGRHLEMVRLLMEYGADARVGVYPHRDATSPFAIAFERGYDEIVAIIYDAEGRDDAEGKRMAPASDPVEAAPETLELRLWHCAGSGDYAGARALLDQGANPNGRIYASGSPMLQAFSQRDERMIELLRQYGAKPEATSAGLFRRTELARQMLRGEAEYDLDGVGGDTLSEQLLWGGACGGDPEIVRMALEGVTWPRDDPRWFTILEQPLRIWRYGVEYPEWDRTTFPVCFRMVLERANPNITARFGITILHSVAGSRRHVTADEREVFATMLLDAGARLDIRDDLLRSTPLGWACRYGRPELVRLYLDRGADREEPDAEPWAAPRAWLKKMGLPIHWPDTIEG